MISHFNIVTTLRIYWEPIAMFALLGFFVIPMTIWLGSLVVDHAQPIKGSEYLIPYTPWILVVIILVMNSALTFGTWYSYHCTKSDYENAQRLRS